MTEDQYKIQVLKPGADDWQDLNSEFFTFDDPEEAAKIASRYNKNPNPYTYRAVKLNNP